jgi:sugar lactone lactonase YvrE
MRSFVAVYGPRSVTIDVTGNLYFADGQAVLRLDSKTGMVSRVAGSGDPGFSGDNGLATEARLNAPAGVVVDGAGTLYIADSGNSRIRKVTGGVITTIAGGGRSGDNGPAVNAQLSFPYGLTVDSAGNLYIADHCCPN